MTMQTANGIHSVIPNQKGPDKEEKVDDGNELGTHSLTDCPYRPSLSFHKNNSNISNLRVDSEANGGRCFQNGFGSENMGKSVCGH